MRVKSLLLFLLTASFSLQKKQSASSSSSTSELVSLTCSDLQQHLASSNSLASVPLTERLTLNTSTLGLTFSPSSSYLPKVGVLLRSNSSSLFMRLKLEWIAELNMNFSQWNLLSLDLQEEQLLSKMGEGQAVSSEWSRTEGVQTPNDFPMFARIENRVLLENAANLTVIWDAYEEPERFLVLGEEATLSPGGLKFTTKVEGWNWQYMDSLLVMRLEVTHGISSYALVFDNRTGLLTQVSIASQWELDFLHRHCSDGEAKVSSGPIVKPASTAGVFYVDLAFPHFSDSLIYDPDLGIVFDFGGDGDGDGEDGEDGYTDGYTDGEDGDDGTNDRDDKEGKDDDVLPLALGLTFGLLFGVVLLLGGVVSFLWYRRWNAKRVNQQTAVNF